VDYCPGKAAAPFRIDRRCPGFHTVQWLPRGGNTENSTITTTSSIDQTTTEIILGSLDRGKVDNVASKKNSEAEKKPRRFRLFGGRSQPNKKQEDEDQKPTKKSEKKAKKNPKKKEERKDKGATKTTNTTENQQQKDQPTPPKNGESNKSRVIILGSPSQQQQQQQQQQQYRMIQTPPPHGMMRPSAESRSALITDLLAALIRIGTRIWMILWIKTWASEHETIKPVQHFVWERLNDRYTEDAHILNKVLEEPPHGIRKFRWRREHNWRVVQRSKSIQVPLEETFTRTVVVVQVPIDGSGKVNLPYLSDIVSFLLQQYRGRAFGTIKDKIEKDGLPMPLEVVLLIKSGGGSVSQYGLAAAQVQRLATEEGIKLTVSVDQAAASGGYMVASQAHNLIAAPFATLGSVGVMLESFNVRDALKNLGVAPISLKAGKHKNTLSLFGPITAADEKHEVDRLRKVHDSFREFVVESRPTLADSMNLLEGQVFLGEEALQLGLVDGIQTSDEYIMERIEAGDRVLKLHQSKLQSSRRRVQLSPLDLLPHMRNWISKRISSANAETVASWVLSLSSIWGFANHLYQKTK